MFLLLKYLIETLRTWCIEIKKINLFRNKMKVGASILKFKGKLYMTEKLIEGQKCLIDFFLKKKLCTKKIKISYRCNNSNYLQ